MEQLQQRDTQAESRIGILQNFSAVNSVDGSQRGLPARCKGVFAGSGGCASEARAKIQVSYEYLRGEFNAIEGESGPEPDQQRRRPTVFACANSLSLMELGDFSQAGWVAIAQAAAFFLTRLHPQVNLYWKADDSTTAALVRDLNRQSVDSRESPVY